MENENEKKKLKKSMFEKNIPQKLKDKKLIDATGIKYKQSKMDKVLTDYLIPQDATDVAMMAIPGGAIAGKLLKGPLKKGLKTIQKKFSSKKGINKEDQLKDIQKTITSLKKEREGGKETLSKLKNIETDIAKGKKLDLNEDQLSVHVRNALKKNIPASDKVKTAIQNAIDIDLKSIKSFEKRQLKEPNITKLESLERTAKKKGTVAKKTDEHQTMYDEMGIKVSKDKAREEVKSFAEMNKGIQDRLKHEIKQKKNYESKNKGRPRYSTSGANNIVTEAMKKKKKKSLFD